ncbi:guanine nucleotide-binding protein subunit beta-like protein 1 [Cavenderia fasciculata]|uniref:Guanine nucleotide-binding protein subunit beta-like protein 1 n=1 Tax=Cavenderia fasciculata TaxID=261658 RepID=F4Q2M5_CACFS|nr:guanine nucleotide-binding protein subunit beta-like protein 1 [Cavenderia fasciculata]EGG17492.1 guanine nucleotide-binding protein subunit beta-like protein 1 [Cavenderia fasciculata]|eukprot:XP_004355976.1 guanine nucleotide-binding protein subunit beta-like protein 1 [Cavenderia fasciculata]
MSVSPTLDTETAPDPFFVLRGHRSFINSIVFDRSNSNLLFSGSGDGELRCWNIEEKKCVAQVARAHPEGGTLALQSTHFNTLLSQGRDGTIRQWTIAESSLQLVSSLETNSISLGKFTSMITALPIFNNNNNNNNVDNNIPNLDRLSINNSSVNDQNNLISISSDEVGGQVEIWDLGSKTMVAKVNGSSDSDKLGMAMSMKMVNHIDHGYFNLYAGFENGGLYMWDSRNLEQPIIATPKLHQEPLLSFDIQSDSGVSGSGDTSIIEFKSNFESRNFDIVQKHVINHNGIADVKIRGDGRIFATAGWDKRVRIFSFRKHCPLAILRNHTESIYTIDFSSDNVLASAGKDGRIALCDKYRLVLYIYTKKEKERMLRSKVIPQVLQQASNSNDVKGVLLMKEDGSLIACSDSNDHNTAKIVSAISSSIWTSYNRNDELQYQLVDCEEGRLVITKVAKLLLCIYAEPTVEFGLLKTKATKLREYLQEPLSQVEQV